jgi:hypothetical protein
MPCNPLPEAAIIADRRLTTSSNEASVKKEFKAQLTARGPGGAWTFLPIPFDVEKAFGTKARVPVAGTMNGFAFRNSLLPQGDGTHAMAVNKELQAGAKAAPGDVVRVSMAIDTAARTVTIPVELKDALATDKKAAAVFASLSPSHKKEFADWISEAKKAQTRLSRAEKSLGMIVAKKHR